MKYRTGFVTNSSSVSFYIGKKDGADMHTDDAFRIWRDCWNEYYDAMENVFNYLLESDEWKFTVLIGTYEEIEYALLGRTDLPDQDDDEDIYIFLKSSRLSDLVKKQLKEQFGIHVYEINNYTPYDPENRRVVREPWMAAETYKEALALGFTNIFVHFIDLSDELTIKWAELYRMKQNGQKNSEEYRKHKKECMLMQKLVEQENPTVKYILFEENLKYLEGLEQSDKDLHKECQVIIDSMDDSGFSIPDFVYNRMKERSIFTVFVSG